MNSFGVNGGWQNEVAGQEHNVVFYQQMNFMQLPLLQRLQMGPQVCTVQEWEAARWLNWKFNSAVNRYDPMPYIERMKHQAMYSGTCWIEVPFLPHNPQLPQIVNEIMSQFGGKLIDYEVYNQVVNTCDLVPHSVILIYKTMTPDIRNVPIFEY